MRGQIVRMRCDVSAYECTIALPGALLTVVLLPIPPDEASVELRPFEGSPLDPLMLGHMRIYACI